MPDYSPAELARWTQGRWDPRAPDRVVGVSNDTRTIGPGQVYVALKGERFDGHDFVADALAMGAAAAMVDVAYVRPAAVPTDVPLLRVVHTGRALLAAGAGYRKRIDPDIVGVTGSAGKSTVKEMIAQVLARKFRTACTRGNWNNEIGLPLSLLAMPGDAQVGVFEVGMNHPGELAPLCNLLESRWGVITSIGPVHIEFFGSEQAIAEEKSTLIRSLPPSGIAVLNSDSPFYGYFCSQTSARIVTVSMSTGSSADYVCRDRTSGRGEAMIEERCTGTRVLLKIPLKGEFNIANAMLAVAVSRSMGVEWERISEGLEGYRPLPMRWEESRVREIRIINDAYNANPLSMKAAAGAFAEERGGGGRWLLLGGMLELGEHSDEGHREVGKFVARGTWNGLITVGELGAKIAEGAVGAGFPEARVFRCETAVEAAGSVLKNLGAGDAVLLKASRGIHLENVVSNLHQQ